ncbi:hypothetical protein [Evansella clarkii]|uniref:hypothetical protein n=1 Tax=Evansella clarkii TaxID=79879 RepID=UPI000998679B|nr:hypothetical protein [Evansella clarkii]
MKLKDLCIISSGVHHNPGSDKPHLVRFTIDFKSRKFQKVALYYAVSYDKNFCCTEKLFYKWRSNKYSVNILPVKNEEEEEKLAHYGNYRIKNSMLDFVLAGKWEWEFGNKEMAEAAAAAGVKRLERELNNFINLATFNRRIKSVTPKKIDL